MYLTHLIPDLQEGRKFHEKEMGNENKKTAKAAQTDPVSISCMHASDRIIFIGCQYGGSCNGYSTAVGLFNSVVNVILLIFVNWVVKKLNDGEGL